MRIFKKLFIHSFKHYMIALGALVGLIIIFMSFYKFNPSRYPSAFATSGLLLTFVGLLLMLGYLGAFDTFGYAFTTFKSRSRRPYKDLVEYSEVKSRNRKVKDYFFVPYIVVGFIFFIIGMVNWLFVKPLPKLDPPQEIKIEVISETELSISWNKNDKALNGYHLEIKEYYDGNDEDILAGLYNYDIKVPQSDSNKITIDIEIPDTSKKYIIRIICLATEDYNGSDAGQCTHDPE